MVPVTVRNYDYQALLDKPKLLAFCAGWWSQRMHSLAHWALITNLTLGPSQWERVKGELYRLAKVVDLHCDSDWTSRKLQGLADRFRRVGTLLDQRQPECILGSHEATRPRAKWETVEQLRTSCHAPFLPSLLHEAQWPIGRLGSFMEELSGLLRQVSEALGRPNPFEAGAVVAGYFFAVDICAEPDEFAHESEMLHAAQLLDLEEYWKDGEATRIMHAADPHDVDEHERQDKRSRPWSGISGRIHASRKDRLERYYADAVYEESRFALRARLQAHELYKAVFSHMHFPRPPLESSFDAAPDGLRRVWLADTRPIAIHNGVAEIRATGQQIQVSDVQSRTLQKLIEVFPEGLTQSELEKAVPSGRKAIRELPDELSEFVATPGVRGGKYRLRKLDEITDLRAEP